MPRAHLQSEEFHKVHMNEERIWQWTNEWFGFTDAGLSFLQEKGFQFVKVTADEGDLIIWDSRCPHYNCSPTSDRTRFAVYTCYAPVSTATQDDLIRKKVCTRVDALFWLIDRVRQIAFETFAGTSHWAQCLQTAKFTASRNGQPDPKDNGRPRKDPILNDRQLHLTGIPYIKATA